MKRASSLRLILILGLPFCVGAFQALAAPDDSDNKGMDMATLQALGQASNPEEFQYRLEYARYQREYDRYLEKRNRYYEPYMKAHFEYAVKYSEAAREYAREYVRRMAIYEGGVVPEKDLPSRDRFPTPPAPPPPPPFSAPPAPERQKQPLAEALQPLAVAQERLDPQALPGMPEFKSNVGIVFAGSAMLPLSADTVTEAAQLTQGEAFQRSRAEGFFAAVRDADAGNLVKNPCWHQLLKNGQAQAVCAKHLLNPFEPVSGQALALRVLGALDLEGNAEDLAILALRDRRPEIREAARDALLALDVQTPPVILLAVAQKERKALDLVAQRPEEAGLRALARAVDGKLEAAPDPFAANHELHFWKRILREESGPREKAGVSEIRKTFHKVTGMDLPEKGKAAVWWEEHKTEALTKARALAFGTPKR